MCTDTCTEMCTDICADMHADICKDMHTDRCAGMHMEMCADMRGTCLHTCATYVRTATRASHNYIGHNVREDGDQSQHVLEHASCPEEIVLGEA